MVDPYLEKKKYEQALPETPNITTGEKMKITETDVKQTNMECDIVFTFNIHTHFHQSKFNNYT